MSLDYFRIPDSIGKDIEKACQGIFPLHDVYIRKVKILKKPKFDSTSNNSFSYDEHDTLALHRNFAMKLL